MKNSLKIGALALSLLAAFGLILNANAQVWNQVTVTLTQSGSTVCSLWDYVYSADTSFSDQNVTDSNQLDCTFYATAAEDVVLMLDGDLTDGTNIIPSTGVLLTVDPATFTLNGWTVTQSATSSTAVEFTSPGVTVFDKDVNTVGDISLDPLTIDITIPGYTPESTYTAVANLTF